MGGDWPAYTQFFKDVEPLEKVLSNNAPVYSKSYMEPAYKMLNALVKSLGGNMQMVFFIIAFINSCLFFKALRMYCVYPVLGALIYFSARCISL